MISRLHVKARWLRRQLSRARLAARFLGIEPPQGEAAESGLILIQIDGLSREQFERAAKKRNLRFLSGMIKRGHFLTEDFYSGVPSTTPAVQAEIFYQEKMAVPSFQFFDRETGRVMKMYEAESATEIEQRLATAPGRPLLEGGCSYSNIYAAGADESRYCSRDLSIRSILRNLHPLKKIILALTNLMRFFRILGLGLLEFFVALVDLARGLFEGRDFWKEISFIPARITVCILVREAIRFRIMLDLEKGVRVIHANLLGYDEQAHRRGPTSAFAHWTLKGIDRTIRDIHRAAARSPYRDYEMIIYSDHGQEETDSYEKKFGRLPAHAVEKVFAEGPTACLPVWYAKSSQTPSPGPDDGPQIVLTTLGPLAHLYVPIKLSDGQRRDYARALVHDGKIPLVLLPIGDEEAWACNREGEWILPRDSRQVLGPDHPYEKEAAADLAHLTHHPNAGDFVLSGWAPGQKPMTFARENGAHGGPGRNETRGFLLLPERIDRWHHERGPDRDRVIRGTILHRIVRHFLDEEPLWHGQPSVSLDKNAPSLRIVTYNVHGCVGIDGRCRPERIARTLNALAPDLIALQEVDVHRPRSGGLDQAHEISSRLRMEHVFHSMLEEEEEGYGIAILSRFPLELVKKGLLTAKGNRPLQEARGAIWVKVRVDGFPQPVNVLTTHFGLGRQERARQAAVLLGPDWLGSVSADEPVILCGDFNSGLRSSVWRKLQARFDGPRRLPRAQQGPTFPSTRPLVRLDHIFAGSHFALRELAIPDNPSTVQASDHLPLLAEYVPATRTRPCSVPSNAIPASLSSS